MPKSSAPTVHTFVAGTRDEDADGVVLRITASTGYRAGAVPADPVLRRAVTFGTEPSTASAVYVTDGRDEPPLWTRFDDVVALPATDGSPILRFVPRVAARCPPRSGMRRCARSGSSWWAPSRGQASRRSSCSLRRHTLVLGCPLDGVYTDDVLSPRATGHRARHAAVRADRLATVGPRRHRSVRPRAGCTGVGTARGKTKFQLTLLWH